MLWHKVLHKALTFYTTIKYRALRKYFSLVVSVSLCHIPASKSFYNVIFDVFDLFYNDNRKQEKRF